MKALKNNIVVGEVAEEKTTEFGLILSKSIDGGSRPAKVLSIGPEVTEVAVGDTVAIKWGEGLAVTENGQMLVVISEEHVYAIFD